MKKESLLETICPLTEERCPYQKLLIDGVCDEQLTCPVVDVSFNKMRNPRKILSKKILIVSYYAALILILSAFTYVFFFTDYIRSSNPSEISAPIPSGNDNEYVVLIDNDVSLAPVEIKPVLEEIPVTSEAPVAVKQIHISSLSVSAEVIGVGLNKYNLIEAFPSKDIVSWYEKSALPGEMGNCILVGSKYFNNFTAVFHGLDQLNVNDPITIVLDNGSKITQKVYDIVYYTGNILPEKVLDLEVSYPVTTLISKAGEIDLTTGDYDSFIVVLAH